MKQTLLISYLAIVLLDIKTSFRRGSTGGLLKNTNNALPEVQRREIQVAILVEQGAIQLVYFPRFSRP